MEAEQIRSRAVEIARGCVGLCADPAQEDSRRRYLEMIAPGEPEGKQREMATMSGCGLLVGGIWRALGVQAGSLAEPYKIGSAVSRLVQIAHAAKAWVPFKEGAVPSPGDMVLVGDNAKGGVEHVYTVVDVTVRDGEIEIESVDGGQRDAKGLQAVSLKRRVWKGRQDCVASASDPGGDRSGGRTIQGWVDVSRLPIGG